MFKHPFLEDLPLYAAGALGPAERETLEKHLQEGCEVCEAELFAYQDSVSRLPFALKPVMPADDLKDKIWSKIDAERRRKGEPRLSRYALAAAVAVAVFLITGAVLWQQNLQLIRKDREIAKMRQAVEQQEREIQWLRDPAVQLAMLTGLSVAPDARGKMVWNPEVSRGIFYVNSLPAVPAEKSYQLWVIGKEGPISAAVFQPDPGGSAVVIVSRLPSQPEGPLQFAVTIEPRGGRPQPTGAMVLAGKPL